MTGGGIQPGLGIEAYRALVQGALGSRTGHHQHDHPRHAAHPGRPLGGARPSRPASSTSAHRASSSWAPWRRRGRGHRQRLRPPIVAIPLALLAGIAAGAAWGFIPGCLKAFTGAHEVVVTIMLNFIAVVVLTAVVSGPLDRRVALARSPPTWATRHTPSSSARPDTSGILVALVAVAVRLVAPLAHDPRLRDPDRGRQPGRGALRRHATAPAHHPHDVARRAAGRPRRRREVLGVTHRMTPSFGTTVGFDSIAVALLGRTNPSGSSSRRSCFGAHARRRAADADPGGHPRRAGRRPAGRHPAGFLVAAPRPAPGPPPAWCRQAASRTRRR